MRKKAFIWVAAICIVAIFIAFYTMSNSGWRWHLPQPLLEKVDFDQICENISQMLTDGYTNVASSDANGDGTSYAILGRADDGNATPMIYVYLEDGNGDDTKTNALQYDAHTTFFWNLRGTVGNKDQYHFEQEITIRCGKNKIWMIYYTKNLFSGRQQAVDYLSQFCDSYCPD